MPDRYPPFGPDHLGALVATALIAALLIRHGRARRGRPGTGVAGRCLAYLMLGAFLADPIVYVAYGQFTWATALPLELCDAAGVATIAALLTRRQPAFELAYFWGLSGTLQALLTPALHFAFPHPDFIRYFVLHSGIVVGVLYLGPGLGMRPRRGAVWRAVGWTVAYAVAIGLIDAALEANYMWLREPPPGSILDLFGPWPLYILGGTAIGILLFLLLDLPYRRRR
ncbi:MAG: YwaF family protein [Planctomycetota bacterium]|jgi:hypothetical integral membrane protein (TIGR02206 family)